MPLTPRRLNRATLARQLLLERPPVRAVEAVGRIAALQAQEPASPYLALWNRIEGFDPADLDDAFAQRAILKAPLMRITLHAVTANDYPLFHQAVLDTLRSARLRDARFTSTGLSIDEADSLVPHLVEFTSTPRGKSEIEELLSQLLGSSPEPGVWWALKSYAPLVHAPTGGPWSFGRQPAYLAAPQEPSRGRTDASVRHLIRSYLQGFGPATAKDIGQFALLRMSTVRPALEAMREELATLEGPGGTVLLDLPGAPLPAEETPAPPRLLGMWDSVLLAYSDRDRVIPPEYRKLVIRRNGDVLPTLLVDGYVCGVWRPVEGGIEATAFHLLPDDVWARLASEADDLSQLLARRDPTVYSRYRNWWDRLPDSQVRVLPVD